MLLFPAEYQAVIHRQQLGRHESELLFTQIYDEIVTAIIERAHLDGGIENLVRHQLNNMRPIPVHCFQNSNDHFDSILHMGRDQYQAYSTVMDAIN
jgi:hypothetical protein